MSSPDACCYLKTWSNTPQVNMEGTPLSSHITRPSPTHRGPVTSSEIFAPTSQQGWDPRALEQHVGRRGGQEAPDREASLSAQRLGCCSMLTFFRRAGTTGAVLDMYCHMLRRRRPASRSASSSC